MRIGPDVPDNVIRQTDDWSCSVRASYAALYVLHELGLWDMVTLNNGRLSYERFRNDLVQKGIANADVGNTDASGGRLAAYLKTWLPHLNVYNLSSVSLAQVQELVRAGNLVLIGGRSWGPFGHWALAVGVEDDGTLMLENPAGCYNLQGTNICDQLLTSWAKSSWSAVVISARATLIQPVPPLPPGDNSAQRIAALERELADCRNLVGNAYNDEGVVVRALRNLEKDSRAIISFLQANRPK